MRIAENGLPRFTIILPPRPSPAEEFAADDLRRHLLAMLGLPPVAGWEHAGAPAAELCINGADRAREDGLDPAARAPGPETFYLAPGKGNRYHILGGGPRGTLYGVYELLHRLGCRWFTPEVAGIPRVRDIDLPAAPLAGAPAFEYRDILCWDSADPLWRVRNRLNGLFSPVPDCLGGHDVFGYLAHSTFALVPPSVHFAAHPEYYSEIKGVRRHVAGQLCLTHPDVLRIAGDTLLAYMRARPEARLFSVSQMDWEGWCECAACRAAAEETGSQSGLYIRFVNALAERTAKEFPDRLITTLAYHYTEAPPRQTMKLHPNVRVQMCPIHTCQLHPFEECGSPQDQRFLERIRGWSAMTDQLYIWHYATDFSHYTLPLPNLRQLHANVRFYKRNGVRGLFMQANGFSELSDLKGYLLARQLWDPETGLEEVLDEFLPAVYGGGAGAVRAYIDLLDGAAADRTHHLGCYEPPDHPFYTDALLEGARDHLRRAERAAGPESRKRIARLLGGVELALLYRAHIKRPFRREGRFFHNGFSAADAATFRKVMKARREAGKLPLSESVPFELSEGRYGLWFEKHRLLELKAGRQSLFVAPALGGRLIEWRAEGRQLLEPPDPENRHFQYPLSEGCAEMAIDLPYNYRGSVERYEVLEKGRAAVRLAAEVGDGFRMERAIRLTPDALLFRGTLTNGGAQTRNRQWGGSLHLNTAAWRRLTVRTAAGVKVFERRPDRPEPAGFVVLSGAEKPAGGWRLEFESGPALEAEWTGEIVSLIVERNDARDRLAIDLRTETLPFPPGQARVVEQAYRWT